MKITTNKAFIEGYKAADHLIRNCPDDREDIKTGNKVIKDKKPAKFKKRKYKISEERIQQIINDIAEDMESCTNRELIEVVKYYGDELQDMVNKFNDFKDDVLIGTVKNSEQMFTICSLL